jgi:hypothetical protein
MNRTRKLAVVVLVLLFVGVVSAIYYVRSHPLVFNESLWQHAHCMKQAGMALRIYASQNNGRFPNHPNGYGDALLMMSPHPGEWHCLTGPGYNTSAFAAALASGGDVDESRCGRVYVQGLNEANDPRIALLFDKVAAPDDHCQFPYRLWAGFVREVCFVDATSRAVPVEQWAGFAREQIDLLVAAGLTREQAEKLYAEVK